MNWIKIGTKTIDLSKVEMIFRHVNYWDVRFVSGKAERFDGSEAKEFETALRNLKVPLADPVDKGPRSPSERRGE